MARKKAGTVPDLQRHRATGQGKVHLSGRDFYCGKWGTPACKATYATHREARRPFQR